MHYYTVMHSPTYEALYFTRKDEAIKDGSKKHDRYSYVMLHTIDVPKLIIKTIAEFHLGIRVK